MSGRVRVAYGTYVDEIKLIFYQLRSQLRQESRHIISFAGQVLPYRE